MRTLAGAVLGGGLLLLAASLPGVSLLGLYLGVSVTSAAILAWTHPDRPGGVWVVQGAQIVVLSIWTVPWVRHLRVLPRLGAAWTGVSFWLLGIAGAVLTGLVTSERHYFVVGAQRVAYLALAVVAVVAVVKAASSTASPARSVSVGLTAAFLVTLGVLFILGSANIFEGAHAAPNHSGARYLENRFWGGTGVFYHPVSMAGIAVAVTLRVGPDSAFRRWQRLAAVAVSPLVIVLTQTRTAAVLLVAGAVVAVALWARNVRIVEVRLPSHRGQVLMGVAAAVVVVAGSLAIRSRIADFFTVERYGDAPLARRYGRADDVTSGRVATWEQVFREFRSDGWTEKLLGSAERSRATVLRPGDDPEDPVTIVTDNAAVGSLRRGGLLGVATFVVGLFLLVRHALRSGSRWFVIAAVASLATIPTTDWLLGSPLWFLLLSAEAATPAVRAPRDPS